MNILVLLHPLRDPASFIVNRRAQKVFVNREAFILNPADRHALEAALRLAAARRTVSTPGNGHGAHVLAVALADDASAPQAEDVLRQALATGAERAILAREAVWPRDDAAVAAAVLQRIIQHLGGVDLVLLGADMPEGDLAQVGPRLAAALHWPFVDAAYQVQLESNTLQAIVKPTDVFRAVAADLPLVASIAPNSHKPRYAPGRDLVTVYSNPAAVETLSFSELGLGESDLAPTIQWVGESFPPEREMGVKLEGDLAEQTHQVADLLARL